MGQLRVLIAEDDPLDAELIVRALIKSGYHLEWHRVDREVDFMNQLAKDPPDVIISDHAMPQFGSAAALQCLQNSQLSIPFIVVSHAIGEEEAVRLMHQGAADFLMKDRLGRLGEAVRQGLDKHRLQQAHTEAERALRGLNEELESRIAQRTAELQAANHRLEKELESRAQAEEALQRLNAELEQRIEKRTRDVVASHHRLRALASELTLAEQRERKRLAGELHDYLAQMLALGRMKIAQLRGPLAAAPSLVQPVREIDDVFKNALTYTRTLMAKLSPPVLDELGLSAALGWLAEQMPLQGLAVEVRVMQEEVPLLDEQAVLLFQSVRELLINVAKHAGTGHATVTLHKEGHRLHIEVQDAGCGFDVTNLEAKSSGEHFGLLSVRERMEAMGGSFDLKSTPGQGTTAILTLPLPREATEVKPYISGLNSEAGSHYASRVDPRPGSDLAARLSPRAPQTLIRVLLVDDHVMVRQGLKALLESFPGLSVVGEAGDGEEGLAMAAQCEPDVVLMDVNMPWMDGIEATKRIKQEWPQTLVVGLSVNNSPQIIEAMKTAGAASFVAKDAAADQLYETIVTAMALRGPSAAPGQSRLR